MRYVANPVVVDAWVIEGVKLIGNGTVELDLRDYPHSPYFAGRDMTARYIPVLGDYVVMQADGYVYLNPKAVFERKYRPLETA